MCRCACGGALTVEPLDPSHSQMRLRTGCCACRSGDAKYEGLWVGTYMFPDPQCAAQALCKNSGSTLGYGFGSSTVDLDDEPVGPDDSSTPRAPLVEVVI